MVCSGRKISHRYNFVFCFHPPQDTENSHFYLFEFVKTAEAPENVKAGLELRPCLYKKR